MDQLLKEWNIATSNLPYGVQRVFLDTLNLVKEEKIHLVHGADYRDGKPCLVNAVGAMLTTGGGNGIPSEYFGHVVGMFDRLNSAFLSQGVNEDGYVSPLAAEIMIRNFGALKPEPDPETLTVAEESHGAYVEPSDEEFARDFMEGMKAPAPEDIERLANEGNDVARFAHDYISGQRQANS